MKSRTALAAVFALAFLAPGLRGEDEGIAWLKDLDAARTTARAEGKPLFIVFR
jgi:hypothetical protein